jgi:hypothetical protein
MIQIKQKILFILIFIGTLSACTNDINLVLPEGEEKLVVEGHIEPGLPPIIMLTRSVAYFSSTTLDDIANSFVHNAVIKISDGTVTDSLIEVNLSTLPDSIAQMILDLYQINVNDISPFFNFSFYTSFSMFGEVGKTYSLTIEAEGKKLSSVTTIPKLVIPDSFWLKPSKDPANDSMVMLYFSFQDPPDEVNSYRYFTKRNDQPFYPNQFGSVFDDNLFNGQDIDWNLSRGSDAYDSFDIETYGMFWKGDTVTVKFCTIDAAHRLFWQTFEMARSSGGPYSNPVKIMTNIVGGLGVWGGYGAYYHTVYIPE